ncbi:hypothetical protein ABT023_02040 [Micromonospora sp. NPDC002296]|uniref:hypothetical protein n=1 Tax=Micromonospora sp. NPDC002296 TaxID=3154271 RepID=UPI00331CF1CC
MPPPRDLVRRLYEEPPDRFVATRDAAVAEARRAGDPATAREIARLRRPTVAAWLVNLLAIRCPELVADLGRLAEALRAAQRDLRGPRLRELSAQRRAVVAALVAEVRRLAADAEGGPPGGKLPLAEVEATLNAALSDTTVAEQVRTGRLLRAASYAGFGEVPRPQLRLVTDDAEPAPPAVDRATDRDRDRVADRDRNRRERDERAAERAVRAERVRQRRALERELTKARTDQGRAEAELAGAADAEHDGTEELADIERSLAELERRRAEAEQELSRRKLARRAAERAVTAARRRTGEVEGAIEAIDAEEGTDAGGGGGAD